MAFPAAALAEGLCQGLGPKSCPATSQRLRDWDWMVGSSLGVRSDLVPRRPAHQGPRSPTFSLPASHPFECIGGWFPVFWESLRQNVSKSRKEDQVMRYIRGKLSWRPVSPIIVGHMPKGKPGRRPGHKDVQGHSLKGRTDPRPGPKETVSELWFFPSSLLSRPISKLRSGSALSNSLS